MHVNIYIYILNQVFLSRTQPLHGLFSVFGVSTDSGTEISRILCWLGRDVPNRLQINLAVCPLKACWTYFCGLLWVQSWPRKWLKALPRGKSAAGNHLDCETEVAAVGDLSSTRPMPPALCSCLCWHRRLGPAVTGQIKSVTISWKLFNNPKPSVRQTKARPWHGPAQNAAIHREGEARVLAKPFTLRERDL